MLKIIKAKILRTAYINALWQNASEKALNPVPENYGWISESNNLSVNWYEGKASPLTIDEILIADESDGEDDLEIYLLSGDESED